MNVRMAGARKIALGIVGSVVAWSLFAWARGQGFTPNAFLMIPLATPAAWGLAGLLEVVTGLEFTQIARKWDELAGWQRGVLGLLVVALAVVVMMGAIVLFG
jgi:hypothetical protein